MGASSPNSPSHCTSSSGSSTNGLNINPLPRNTNHVQFEKYFTNLIRLGREVLTSNHSRDHSPDRTQNRTRARTQHWRGRGRGRGDNRILTTDNYLVLRDQIHRWIASPPSVAPFLDHETYLVLAVMATAMRTIEIALAIPHRPVHWPGAAPGTDAVWPAVRRDLVYRCVDNLVYGGGGDVDVPAMPWDR